MSDKHFAHVDVVYTFALGVVSDGTREIANELTHHAATGHSIDACAIHCTAERVVAGASLLTLVDAYADDAIDLKQYTQAMRDLVVALGHSGDTLADDEASEHILRQYARVCRALFEWLSIASEPKA